MDDRRLLSRLPSETRTRWCIVVADAAGPKWPPSAGINAQMTPVQYCSLVEPTTMIQKALHRAGRISHRMATLVTAAEVHRPHWQQALWFTRAEHRFVSHLPGWSWLTTAAAVLSIAARSPSSLITVMPARCYVEDEWILTVALHRVLSAPSLLIDGIVTLGISGAEPGIDEDYLVLRTADHRPTIAVAYTARRPVDRIARQFVQRGALVATGIYIASASTLAAHLFRHWPTLTNSLVRYLDQTYARGEEIRIPAALAHEALGEVPPRIRDRPSRLNLRALPVAHCGWSSLRSAQAIERIAAPQPTQRRRAARRVSM
jgi:mannose-1-phosphate guanylyltransferase